MSQAARRAGLAALLAAALVGACAPRFRYPGPAVTAPSLTADSFTTADGQELPVRSWLPQGAPKAVIAALHGYNDYAKAFDAPGGFLAGQGIATYAYDQRGFGESLHVGLWAGVDAYLQDLRVFTELLRQRHPGLPLYLLGDSMGGAVVMAALAGAGAPAAEGAILVAPAVWGRITMPWYQRLALWLGVHSFPGRKLTGEGLKITPSDNIEMLRALGRDPLVIKGSRIDMIYGLVNLMDAAFFSAPHFTQRALVLYGEKDEIVPKEPTYRMIANLPKTTAGRRRIALYAEGYHMLLRDLAGETIWRDIAAWIAAPDAALPSGADRYARKQMEALVN